MHVQSDKAVILIRKRNTAAGFQFHLILVACRLQYARFSFINPSFCFCGKVGNNRYGPGNYHIVACG